MATTTTKTSPQVSPGMHAPAGTQITFADFDGVSLWCTYKLEDDEVGLFHVWINGEWVDALRLFGIEQFASWENAVDLAVRGAAEALGIEVMEEIAIRAYQQRTGELS